MLNERTSWFVLAILAVCVPAFADVTDFTYTPTSPVMGESVTYAAVNDGTKSVTGLKWEYKYTSGSCPGTWLTVPTGASSIVFYESRPGTWQVRLTATYGSGPPVGTPPMYPPPPPPAVITKNVTIAPATGFVISSGLNSPTNRANTLLFKFRLKAGMRDCGPNLNGILAQELLTNRTYLSPPYIPGTGTDSPWQPDQPHPSFQIIGNEINDTKGIPNDDRFDAVPVGATFYSRTQKLRLKYLDPCGTTKYIDLGSANLNTDKVNADEWQVTGSVNP